MKEFNIIIAGGRTFRDFDYLVKHMDEAIRNVKKEYKIVIISGTANGADKLGEKYAELKGYAIKRFPAKWNDLTLNPCRIKVDTNGRKYNALAGLARNKEMINYVIENNGGVIVFWDGKSTGTKNTIELAKKSNLKLIIVRY